MKYRKLGKTGLEVSILGFGGSPLGGVFRAVDETEAIRAVRTAIDSGVNYFDTAPFYGLTKAEEVLGKALKGVARDCYHLATKIGRYGEHEFDFSPERTRKSVDESLERLGLEYVDVIQCHDVEFGDLELIIDETIPTLREIQKQGKARFIGVTGFPLGIYGPVLTRINVDIALSYCHYSLNNAGFEQLLPLFERYDVGVVNASPLCMGLLTNEGPPQWHPASEEIKSACAKAARYCREKGWDIAELAVEFSLSNPEVHTTLIGMATVDELQRNLKSALAPPRTEAIAEVQKLLAPIRDKTWKIVGQKITDEEPTTK